MNRFLLPDVRVAFRPIAQLATGIFTGYEALVRATATSADLFAAAHAGGWIVELELEVAARAFAGAAALVAPGERLFVNVHPAALQSPGFAAHLRAVAATNGARLDRTVVEITARAPISDPATALRNIETLRNAGASFALDDVASGHSHLALLDRLQPEYLKVSRWQRSVAAAMNALATGAGCQLIAGGIDNADTAAAAYELGIELGQGDHFGRATSVKEVEDSYSCLSSFLPGTTRGFSKIMEL